MKKSVKIIIALGIIGVVLIGVWLNLDSHTKCKLIYGKNICNFYKMMETISHDPESSDFEKAMQLCQEMENVPKKDSCFEYIAQVVSFYNTERAKEACNEIKEFRGVHKKNDCYSKIVTNNNPCAVCINGCDTCPEGCEECLIGIEKKLKDPSMKWYYNPNTFDGNRQIEVKLK